MERFQQPSFVITNELLASVSSISEKIGKIDFSGNLANRPLLRENNRLLSVYSSLHMDGSSLTVSLLRDILNGNNVSADLHEIIEAENYAKAYDSLSAVDPYSLQQFKMIHGIATKYLLADSGEFRPGLNGAVRELFAWLNASADSLHPLIQSCVFHYETARLQPFSEGSRKMARLWQKALLIKWRPVFAYLPYESQIEKSEAELAKLMHDSAEEDADITAFIACMLRQIDAAADEVTDRISAGSAETSDAVARLLTVMDYGVSYTGSCLMQKMGLKSRESFREHYLRPAVDQNLIRMTIPDRPNSRNQRYIKI